MQAADYKRCSTCKQLRPRSAYYGDLRYRDGLGSRCKRCGATASKRAADAARTADYAARRKAAFRRADACARRLGRDFGNWLAGWVDGEGCFVIRTNTRGDRVTYACEMRLGVRDDDRPILEECRERTGIGRLYAVPITGSTNGAVAWSVLTKADCLALVAILDRYPLRAKKARDYAVWREAVLAWATNYRKRAAINGTADWSILGNLKARLEAGRVYAGS